MRRYTDDQIAFLRDALKTYRECSIQIQTRFCCDSAALDRNLRHCLRDFGLPYEVRTLDHLQRIIRSHDRHKEITA